MVYNTVLILFDVSKKSIGGLLRPVQNVMNEFVRTRISCSKMDGKEKSVKTAMERYFRLAKRVWIRSMPGLENSTFTFFVLDLLIATTKVSIVY